MRDVVALMCGLLFGVGLAVSGMTDTAKVLGFLDVSGHWVPDLAFVMGGAVCVTLLAFPLVLRAGSRCCRRVSRYRQQGHRRSPAGRRSHLRHRLGRLWLLPRSSALRSALPGLENRCIRCCHAGGHGAGQQGWLCLNSSLRPYCQVPCSVSWPERPGMEKLRDTAFTRIDKEEYCHEQSNSK